MRTKEIIQSFVGTSKIVLKDVYTDAETNAIVIKARPTKIEQCRCGLCHRKGKYYDKGQGERRWRALDIGSQMAYIEATVERVRCKKHGVVTAAVPWARHDTWFCRSFEDTLAWLTVQTSHSVVSEFMRVDWHTVDRACKRVYDDLEAASSCRFDRLVNIWLIISRAGSDAFTSVAGQVFLARVHASFRMGITSFCILFSIRYPPDREAHRKPYF